MIAYVVKNWQRDGIQAVEGERCDGMNEGDGGGFRSKGAWCWWGSEVFATVWEARQKAMAARDKRIASLRKQIEKLEAMTFEKPGGA